MNEATTSTTRKYRSYNVREYTTDVFILFLSNTTKNLEQKYLRNFSLFIGAILLFSVHPVVAKTVSDGACAAEAMKAAKSQAERDDPALRMTGFVAARPKKNEAGAGDQFFDASFTTGPKYHVIMWCKGMESPKAMAVQYKY